MDGFTALRARSRPFVYTGGGNAREGDPSIIWEGHRVGTQIGYCHIEKPHNLEVLPTNEFQITFYPVKIAPASAGWAHAVAILE
jgi:hypothetical protein